MRHGKLVPDIFLILKKPNLYKSKLYKSLDFVFGDMLNFYFSEKGLELVSPPHFV